MSGNNLSERALRLRPSAIRQMTRLAAGVGRELITLAGGMPNPLTFPLDELSEIASGEIRNYEGKNLQYGLTIGFRPLVDWIAVYLQAKGIDATADNIVCTTGSQQGIDLVSEVLIDPDDFIFVEIPTYVGALATFYKSGATIVSVRQDQEGIDLADLETKLASVPREKQKLIYLISNFQNPSGITLTEERRRKIPGLLSKYDAHLMEDDPYGEIYFGKENKPPAPVQRGALDRILYLGTFSKLIAPTFRTGWVAAAEPIARKIELAKEAADLCTSMLDQRIVYRFCSAPGFPAHIERLRDFYNVRCQVTLNALAGSMPDGVHWTQPTGGFFVWLTLPQHVNPETFLEEAISTHKVSFVIGRAFIPDESSSHYLRLAFSVESPERIREGVFRLAELIRSRL
jgi:2-aminoadipate transaminase